VTAPEPAFRYRGIVEGFYGPPWSAGDRSWWVEALGRLGMNRYVVAPKEDPLHRARWPERYPADALEEAAALVARGRAHGVEVGFGVSPGLSIRPSRSGDVAALLAKFRDFHACGVRFFVLALDDVPSHLPDAGDRERFGSLAAAHVCLAHAVHETFPDATLWFVPNDYTGVGATDYLEEVGETLAPAIEVAWTGRSTLAPGIAASEARTRAAVLRRRPLLWDNVPVADGPMRRMLHLGRYLGRDPALPGHVSGILLNPMSLPRSSWLTVACAAAYLEAPSRYDPDRAWHDAAAELGRGAPDAFRCFASAHRFSPQDPDPGDTDLARALARLSDSLERGGDVHADAVALRSLSARRRALAEDLAALEDRDLAREIAPWVAGHHEESRRIDAAAQVLCTVFDPGVPAFDRCAAYSVFEGSLTLHPPAATVSYGPRRVFHPQLVSHRDTDAGFGADPALYTGCNLADRAVSLATQACLPRLGGVAVSGAAAPPQRDEQG